MQCKVLSVECVKCVEGTVWSVKCGECGGNRVGFKVWSVECEAWSVKCGV